ncbi:MAG TPA: transcription antitermination factor NusB [Hyphomonadaceae bacterium]|nr:transcription antitermination factor NusB [Hyphomonadaceae bacterium]
MSTATRARALHPANGVLAARLACVQALHAMDVAAMTLAAAHAEFNAGRLGALDETPGPPPIEPDTDHFRSVLEAILRDQDQIDALAAAVLAANWRIERLDALARAILRAGIGELLSQHHAPAAQVISDYLEIAKAFYNDPEPGFINAALDRAAHQLRASDPSLR